LVEGNDIKKKDQFVLISEGGSHFPFTNHTQVELSVEISILGEIRKKPIDPIIFNGYVIQNGEDIKLIKR